MLTMDWEVEYTDEFGAWWEALSLGEQESVAAVVGVLERLGPLLPYPYSADIRAARRHPIRELRIQHGGRPCRVLYAFDPRRTAILLLGGSKAGDRRWYEVNIRRAEQLFDRHLADLEEE
jgi:hypothetical protein